MQSSPTVAFHTLGCKLNFAESSTIGRQLAHEGFRKVGFDHPADVYVINTCSVTENADRECRSVVRKALKINPDAFIAVIGCYAQLKPEEIAGMDGVDLVLGATEKFNLPGYLHELKKRTRAEIHSCEADAADFFVSSYSVDDRTRAFLKIQDGCDFPCSYCTIPLARGSSRSDTIANVVRSAAEIASRGVKEIVLTGVNTGDFRSADGGDFLALVRALDKVEGIARFRISSIEPNLLPDELVEFVARSEKFVPHFHIPLQSGSDHVLKKMRRRYLRDLYRHRVEKIKSVMPHCCIGADVIAGFPGETDADFRETVAFIQELEVSYLHVFTYSERTGTDAINFTDAVPVHERKMRNRILRNLSLKKQHLFYRAHLNQEHAVMFETEDKDGMLHGYTANYIKVKTPYDFSLVRTIKKVRLDAIDHDMTIECTVAEPAFESSLSY